MAGITRTLTFAEGVSTTGPTTTFLQTTQFATYANDAAFVTAKGSAAADGDAYYNTTDDLVKVYENGAWVKQVDESTAQTLTNKTLTNPAINGANQNMGTASNTNRILLPSDTTTNLDALTDTAGLIAYDTTTNEVAFNDGSGWDELISKDDTQTMTNKTLTSPAINGANQNMGTASNTNRILLPNDTTANLDLLTDTAALIAYDTTLNQVVFNAGSGWNALTSTTHEHRRTLTNCSNSLTVDNTQPVFICNTVESGTAGDYNTTTGVYTVPFTGFLTIEARINLSSTSFSVSDLIALDAFVGGVFQKGITASRVQAAYTNSFILMGSVTFAVTASDTITTKMYSTTSSTLSGNNTQNWMTFTTIKD